MTRWKDVDEILQEIRGKTTLANSSYPAVVSARLDATTLRGRGWMRGT